MAEVLPVIGLWQPYASLIGIGAKPWETRHFPPPRRLVGKRVAIQATLRKPTRDEFAQLDDDVSEAFGFCHWHLRIPYGAVVCTAVLAGGWRVIDHDLGTGGALIEQGGPPHRRQTIPDDGFGDYSLGRWCWSLTDVHMLAEPIPLKGRQEVGWPWEPNADQRAALARAAGAGS